MNPKRCVTKNGSFSMRKPKTLTIFLKPINVKTRIIQSTMRPNTLQVTSAAVVLSGNGYRTPPHTGRDELFISEALQAWRVKVTSNVVPSERVQDLFQELNFDTTERQINEMLQFSKLFARRGSSNFDVGNSRYVDGLTFGEFCVLAADLKRFRTQNVGRSQSKKFTPADVDSTRTKNNEARTTTVNAGPPGIARGRGPAQLDLGAPEVFLGGSCNPTTWRADVAIPALDELGISFYNPQVTDWTPDLIELEHRAKEKARVLFFVMDSETRASAGAIEASHIAGQNSRHLVLVLHPYKRNQSILNEPISEQEFKDLSRNQQLLRELVTRRGLPVLDSIPSGLNRTKAILAGNHDSNPPYNIASKLISVRRAFDRVIEKSLDDKITLEQCKCALSSLGYTNHLIATQNITRVLQFYRQFTATSLHANNATVDGGNCNGTSCEEDDRQVTAALDESGTASTDSLVDFNEFCMLSACLSIQQYDITLNGLVSPIKGINLPPPPIFLTNISDFAHNDNCRNQFRPASCRSVPDDRLQMNEQPKNLDSGTSSPQPHDHNNRTAPNLMPSRSQLLNNTAATLCVDDYQCNSVHEEESDSNDSVFSSEDSTQELSSSEHNMTHNMLPVRDIYLGGSCMLRTRWRQDHAIPYFKAKGITYYVPTLHESINMTAVDESTEQTTTTMPPPPITTSPDDAFTDRHDGKTTILGEESQQTSNKDESVLSNSNEIHDNVTIMNSNNSSSMEGSSSSQSMDTTANVDDDGHILVSGTRKTLFNAPLLDASRVLLFVITNETRSLAPMTLAAHYIGLGYNVVLCVQMLPEFCVIGNDKLTPAAVKDYNRGRAYLIDLAKRHGAPVFHDVKSAVECAANNIKTYNSRKSI